MTFHRSFCAGLLGLTLFALSGCEGVSGEEEDIIENLQPGDVLPNLMQRLPDDAGKPLSSLEFVDWQFKYIRMTVRDPETDLVYDLCSDRVEGNIHYWQTCPETD